MASNAPTSSKSAEHPRVSRLYDYTKLRLRSAVPVSTSLRYGARLRSRELTNQLTSTGDENATDRN